MYCVLLIDSLAAKLGESTQHNNRHQQPHRTGADTQQFVVNDFMFIIIYLLICGSFYKFLNKTTCLFTYANSLSVGDSVCMSVCPHDKPNG